MFLLILSLLYLSSYAFKSINHFTVKNSNYNRLNSATSDSISTEIINKIELYIQRRSINDIYSQDKFQSLFDSILSESSIAKIEPEYDYYWKEIETLITNEKRSIQELLGVSSTNQLLKAVESTDIYDPVTVRAFLQTPVFESMIGK